MSDLLNNETKIFSPIIGQFSLIRGFIKDSAFLLVKCIVWFYKSVHDPKLFEDMSARNAFFTCSLLSLFFYKVIVALLYYEVVVIYL